MIKNLYFLFFVPLSLTGYSQHVKFATSGVITYQKRANMYALIKKSINKDNEAYMLRSLDQYTKTQAQFKTSISTLTFSQSQTLYKPEETAEPVSSNFFLPGFDQNNLVYTDLANRKSSSEKKVFEKIFLVKDSVRNIKWKITQETRNIAGYECTRANALIMDSVYVVAFYTDKIIPSGGPESFTGLPGMILGVALPHEHITWFATKVVDMPVSAKDLTPPSKGTLVNRNTFEADLRTYLSGYNKFIKDAIKFFLL